MITGFTGLPQSYDDKTFNLNKFLIKHPSSTFFMHVESGSYTRMGIYNGDLLIIDRAKTLSPNSLVVYENEGRFTLGRLFNIRSETVIVGSIVYVIHKVKDG